MFYNYGQLRLQIMNQEPPIKNSEDGRCGFITRKGQPCRNWAMPRTDPPACRWHLKLDIKREESSPNPYFNLLMDREKAFITRQLENYDLTAEIVLVRIILGRLLDRFNGSGEALNMEDLDRLTRLIFSGARTLSLLVNQSQGSNRSSMAWLDKALVVFSRDYGLNL
jgi:hypothetical protein